MSNYHADAIDIGGETALVVTPAIPDAGPELRRALEIRRQANAALSPPPEQPVKPQPAPPEPPAHQRITILGAKPVDLSRADRSRQTAGNGQRQPPPPPSPNGHRGPPSL